MRRAARLALAAALAASALASPSSASDGDLVRAACAMPHRYLVRVWRGVYPSRSGDILVIPKEPNFLGSNFPHSGPWDYLQDVPLLWYGPGIVPAVGSVRRPVTIASIAPTQAKLLQFDFKAPDGRPLPEVTNERPEPPRLIVTYVWDGGGRGVLDQYPEHWPVLHSLIPKGVWYENASVGSSPSITPATHATIGTGAFPMHSGQVDAEFRLGPKIVRSGQFGPALLLQPTLGDLYDRAMGNRPLVGIVASVTWHLNMMSHGAMWGGGDEDVAALRIALEDEGAEGDFWNLQGKNEPFYRFPAYVNDLPGIQHYTRELDQLDGALDGKWRENSISQLSSGWDTPARIPYETRAVEEVVSHEGFGQDEVPDLLFINNKLIDHVGHVWSANSPEMRESVEWQDADLLELTRFLNRQVGRGEWVLVLTADHGHQFDPAVSGAFQVTPPQLAADLSAAFDGDGDGVEAIQGVRTSQIFLNEDELRQNGHTVEEVAQFVLDYTKGQTGTAVPASERDDLIFSAAIPKDLLPNLPCLEEARE